jgi:hypothetical protein
MSTLEHPTPPRPGLYVAGIDTSLTASGVAHLGARTGAVTLGRTGLTKLKLDRRIPEVAALALEIVDIATRRRTGGLLPWLVLVEAPDTSGSYGGLVERTYLTCRVTELMDGVPVGWVPSAVFGLLHRQGGGKIDGRLKKVW